ncbi:MAG: glycosyltransferase family 4 protein [Gemmatimonadaceae bacterium]
MTADAVGGVWTYALELARTLARRGARVTLATMGTPPSPAQRADADGIAGLRLHESVYRLEWMDEPWEDVERAGEWLLGLERDLAPDVVHLSGYAHGALPFRAPTVVVAHSCVCSWWRAVKGERAPESWDRYRRAVAAGLAGAGAVVAPTRAMLDALDREYGLPLPRALVVPNGRDAARFAPAAMKEPFVLSAGRLWDEAKNVIALGTAACRMSWPVLVAGEERHPGGADAALSCALRPLGRLPGDELAGWMARAAVFALPARYEPFGLSALEAGLSGCALVLGDIPSLREVWGDAALYVSPDDPGALAETLRALAADAERRTALGERARARGREYTPERMADGYAAAYLAAGGAASAARDAVGPPRREVSATAPPLGTESTHVASHAPRPAA